ncbi:MAG: hypothetical protein DI570_10315 [Phenylobacterium zucineum]|nr:MAG: hypothetical protein DI570_10315 [Phenylobacterium zucineum]
MSGTASATIVENKPGEGKDPDEEVVPSWSLKYEHVAKGDIEALRGDPLPDANTSTFTAAYELGYQLTPALKLTGGAAFSRAEDFDPAGDDSSGVTVSMKLTTNDKIGAFRPYASYTGEAAFADTFGEYSYLDHTVGVGAEWVSTNYYLCERVGAADDACKWSINFKVIPAYSQVFSDDDTRDRGTPSLAFRAIGTAPARISWTLEAKGELRRFTLRDLASGERRKDDRVAYALTFDFARTIMPTKAASSGQPAPRDPWLQELSITIKRIENDSNVSGKDLHELQIVPTIKIGRKF